MGVDMSELTHDQFRRISSEARRKGIPWAMLLAAAALIGVAVGCALLAFGV